MAVVPVLCFAAAGDRSAPVDPDIGIQAACLSPIYCQPRQCWLQTEGLP